MKTKTFASLFVACTIVFFSSLSCGKVAEVAANNCENAAKKVTDAASVYASDPTNKAKCNAYVDAISELIKDCPNFYTGAVKQQLLDFQKNACK